MEMKVPAGETIAPNPEPFLARRFAIDETVFGVRDVELSNPAAVVGYDERGFVLVVFADGMQRSLPAQSVERVVDRKDGARFRPICHGKDWEESRTLGEYLTRLGSADLGIFTKEKRK